MTVRLSGFAITELELIADCIARDNPQRAITFVRALREKCLGLAKMPFAFPLVPRFEAYGVRHRGYGNFQIFYRVKGDPPVQIDVLHVLHGARDYASIPFRAGRRISAFFCLRKGARCVPDAARPAFCTRPIDDRGGGKGADFGRG